MTDEPTIGYFAHVREEASYWGALALLTTDGDPLDFFYTERVLLPRLTQQLLGARADAYVVDRILLKPLIEQAGTGAALLCFDDPLVLQRRLKVPVPAAVLGLCDARHREGEWQFHAVQGSDGSPGWWVQAESAEPSLSVLLAASRGLAPFGLADAFRQVRAAMTEVRP